jgi:putative glycosyltransferase (TIGR04372 family)
MFHCQNCSNKENIPVGQFRDELFTELERRVYCIEALIARGRLGRFSTYLLGRSLYLFSCDWNSVVRFIFPSLLIVAVGHEIFNPAINVFLEKGQNSIILAHVEFYSHTRKNSWCANFALFDIWKRKMIISPFLSVPHHITWILRSDMARRAINYYYPYNLPQTPDFSGVFPKWREEDIRMSDAEFDRMKLDPKTPYVCFLARDNKYYESVKTRLGVAFSEKCGHRNTPVSLYREAMSWLAQKGYNVFRMGSSVGEELEVEAENVIDYASKYRTEFMDVYLSTTCRLFVSCGTGIDALPIVTGIPVALVNYVALAFIQEKYDMENIFLLSQRFCIGKSRRLLSLREAYSLGIVAEFIVGDYRNIKRLGITFVHNTQREILQMVQEVEARLDGTWLETELDRELQERYRSIVRENENLSAGHEIKYRFSAHFLRENAEWFLK